MLVTDVILNSMVPWCQCHDHRVRQAAEFCARGVETEVPSVQNLQLTNVLPFNFKLEVGQNIAILLLPGISSLSQYLASLYLSLIHI